jgi:hypothetical protein
MDCARSIASCSRIRAVGPAIARARDEIGQAQCVRAPGGGDRIAEQLRDEFGERADTARVVTFSAASGEGVPEADAVLSEWLA